MSWNKPGNFIFTLGENASSLLVTLRDVVIKYLHTIKLCNKRKILPLLFSVYISETFYLHDTLNLFVSYSVYLIFLLF